MNISISLLPGRRPGFSRRKAPASPGPTARFLPARSAGISRAVGPARGGFTLIELIAVAAIIAILLGLVGGAAFSARQRAYNAQAQAEAQAIATAFKSYWLAFGRWPEGFGSGTSELDEDNLAPLIGEGPEGTPPFLEVPPDRFIDDGEGSKKYLDPWGKPYVVKFDAVQEPQVEKVFEGACSFPNMYRSYYEDGVYTQSKSDWSWRP